jgi:hypothetical protein
MENFKVVNKNTNATYLLNEKQYETFLLKNKIYKNGVCQYDIVRLTEEKRKRKNKMLDVLAHLCVIGASVLATLLYIENYC